MISVIITLSIFLALSIIVNCVLFYFMYATAMGAQIAKYAIPERDRYKKALERIAHSNDAKKSHMIAARELWPNEYDKHFADDPGRSMVTNKESE